jgi:hypothetical protein
MLQEALLTPINTDFEGIEWGMLRVFLNKVLFQRSQ